jgi:hypothetical protein
MNFLLQYLIFNQQLLLHSKIVLILCLAGIVLELLNLNEVAEIIHISAHFLFLFFARKNS